jgi:hypothetical protein
MPCTSHVVGPVADVVAVLRGRHGIVRLQVGLELALDGLPREAPVQLKGDLQAKDVGNHDGGTGRPVGMRDSTAVSCQEQSCIPDQGEPKEGRGQETGRDSGQLIPFAEAFERGPL